MDFDYEIACNAARAMFEGRLTCTVNVLTMAGADQPALWVSIDGRYIAALMATNIVRGGGWLVAECDGQKLPTFVQHVRDLVEAVDLTARRRHQLAYEHKRQHGPDRAYYALTGNAAAWDAGERVRAKYVAGIGGL